MTQNFETYDLYSTIIQLSHLITNLVSWSRGPSHNSLFYKISLVLIVTKLVMQTKFGVQVSAKFSEMAGEGKK